MDLAQALEKDLAAVHQCLVKYNMYSLRAASLSWKEHLDYLECLFEPIPLPLLAQVCVFFFYSPSLSNATQTPCGTERAPVFPKTNSSNKQGLYADLLDWWLRVFDHDQFTVFAFDLYKRDPDRVEDLVLSNLHLLKNMYVKYTRES